MARGGGGGGRSGGSSSGGSRSSSSHSFSGGHRSSSSFGSGRSSSGRSGFSGSSSRSSYGSSGGYYNRPPGPHGGYYGGPRRSYGGPVRHRRSSPLATVLAFIIVIVILIMVVPTFNGAGGIPRSTVDREKLDGNAVQIVSNYIYDEGNWGVNINSASQGMKEFYKKTGIQPVLVLVEEVYGNSYPNGDDLDRYAAEKYDELFNDGAHLLIVLWGNSNDYCYSEQIGAEAGLVYDTEARDIFYGYFDKYYYSSGTDEEFISKTFEDTADRIMTTQESPVVKIVLVLGAVVVVIIAFSFWKKRKENERAKAAETERILGTDLDSFGDKDVEDLASKYDE